MIVNAVIKGALRKLGVLSTGNDIDAAEGGDALEALQQMYLEMVGAGMFGRQADLFVPTTSSDFTARENARYTVEDLAGVKITLPEAVQDTWWLYSGAGYIPEYGERWVPPMVADEPNGTVRAPRDGSVVTASDLSSTATRTFVYDASIGRWTSLQDLRMTDVAPLSTRYGDGLMCELAIRLAPEYGQEPSAAIVRGAAQGRSAMVCRWDAARRTVVGTYF